MPLKSCITKLSLEQFVLAAIHDDTKANEMGQRAKQVVVEQQGATTRSVDILFSLLD